MVWGWGGACCFSFAPRRNADGDWMLAPSPEPASGQLFVQEVKFRPEAETETRAIVFAQASGQRPRLRLRLPSGVTYCR